MHACPVHSHLRCSRSSRSSSKRTRLLCVACRLGFAEVRSLGRLSGAISPGARLTKGAIPPTANLSIELSRCAAIAAQRDNFSSSVYVGLGEVSDDIALELCPETRKKTGRNLKDRVNVEVRLVARHRIPPPGQVLDCTLLLTRLSERVKVPKRSKP